ncbi:MAG TPA: aspartyl protease family protein [Thermoanaerobaculia bacterium]|jgi:hypothetical protein
MSLVLLLACTSVFGKWFPFKIASNKPFVDVRIAGSAPQLFLFDTGSNASLIDPSLAKTLGFKTIQTTEGNSGVGNAATTFLQYDPPVCEEVAGAAVPDIHFIGFDLSTIASVEGLPVLGTVGGEFIHHFVFVIDYEHRRLQALDPASFDYHGDGTVLPITVDGQIFTKVRLRKRSGEVVTGTFYVDTGTRTALSLNAPFTRANGLLDGETVIPEATLGVGIGGESLASVFRVSDVEIGEVHLHDVVATASHDEKGVFADPNLAGIIGGDLLRKFTVILDYPHKRVILEKTRNSDTPFLYDAAGVFLMAGGPKYDHIRILRVVPGSPAAEAGLQKGDTIEMVDGKPAAVLDDVRTLFLRQGVTYRLRISRDGKSFDKTLKTVDLLSSPTATRKVPAASATTSGGGVTPSFSTRKLS